MEFGLHGVDMSTPHSLYNPEYWLGNLFLPNVPCLIGLLRWVFVGPAKTSWSHVELEASKPVFYGYEPFNYFGVS